MNRRFLFTFPGGERLERYANVQTLTQGDAPAAGPILLRIPHTERASRPNGSNNYRE